MDERNIYGIIYVIRNKLNNKLYIGQTVNSFNQRYNGVNWWDNTHNNHLKNAVNKYGIENFEIDKEFDVACSKEELDKLEDMYIKIYDTINQKFGYNKKFGGANGRLTEETKLKLSEMRIGENNPFYGKTHTKEAKENISKNHTDNSGENNPMYGKIGELSPNYGRQHTEEEIRKISKNRIYAKGENHILYGKHLSEETKQKIRDSHVDNSGKNNPNYGKHMSDETKIKLSESKKGKQLGDSNPNAKKIICITTMKIFNTINEAREYYKCNPKNMPACCKGKIKSCGKLKDGTPLKWMYYNEYIGGM